MDSKVKELLISLHGKIESNAEYFTNKIFEDKNNFDLNYPPNQEFTAEELKILKELPNNLVLKSALKKVFAACTASVIFDMFCDIDGVSEPNGTDDWFGLDLKEKEEDSEDNEFLHDEFYGTYWDWKDENE
jgi:hypothetical protein